MPEYVATVTHGWDIIVYADDPEEARAAAEGIDDEIPVHEMTRTITIEPLNERN